MTVKELIVLLNGIEDKDSKVELTIESHRSSSTTDDFFVSQYEGVVTLDGEETDYQ